MVSLDENGAKKDSAALRALQGFIPAKKRILVLSQELNMLRSTPPGYRGRPFSDGPKPQRSNEAVTNYVSTVMELENRYESDIRGLLAKLTVVESVLRDIDDLYALLLELRYVKGLQWSDVCDEMRRSNMSYDEGYLRFKLHKKAIEAYLAAYGAIYNSSKAEGEENGKSDT